MPKQKCLVCATDEGLFLDVFTDGFNNIIDNCLSLEVKRNKSSPPKICYKCAYELRECNNFIDKFNQTYNKSPKRKSTIQKGQCNLCSEVAKKGFIYELKGKNLNGVFHQIEELFDKDLSSQKSLSVCLYCRYNLDVLSDLRKVSNSQLDGVELPVVSVNVIKRKTTSGPSSNLNDSSSSSSSSSTSPSFSPSSMKNEKSNKNNRASSRGRKCSECQSQVENDSDMFKLHSTGKTVCKTCWARVDSSKKSPSTPRKSKTKPCTVFLKDVLSSERPTRTTRRQAKEQSAKRETDAEGHTVFVISDDSEEETPKKKKRPLSENDAEPVKRVKRETRASSVQNTRSSTRIGTKRRHSDDFEVPNDKPKKAKNKKTSNKSEDDEKSPRKTRASSVKPSGSAKKPVPNKSFSSGDEGTRRSRKAVVSKNNDSSELSSSSSRSGSFSSKKRNDDNKDRGKSKKKAPRKLSSESPVLSDEENSQPYNCSVCSVEFNTTVEGKVHELTHTKTMELVLEKVEVTEANKTGEVEKEQVDEKDESGAKDSSAFVEKNSVVDMVDDVTTKNVEKDRENENVSESMVISEEKENSEDEETLEMKIDDIPDADTEKAAVDGETSGIRVDDNEKEPIEKENKDDDKNEEKENLPADEEKDEEPLKETEKSLEYEENEVNNERIEENEDENEDKSKDKDENEEKDVDEGVLSENDFKSEKNLDNLEEKSEGKKENDDKSLSKTDEPEEIALTNGGNSEKSSVEVSLDKEDKESEEKSKENDNEDAENVNDMNNEEDTEESVRDEEKSCVAEEVSKEKQPVKKRVEELNEANEDDDYESDDEKSPEPEPLSPPPPLSGSDDEDNFGNRLDPPQDFDTTVEAKKTEECKLTEIKPVKPNGRTNKSEHVENMEDEGSLDAIERQMKTIVGDSDGKNFYSSSIELTVEEMKEIA